MNDINLSYIIKVIFDKSQRSKFQYIDDTEKQKWGFIVNRILSKKYPEYAQKLNVRSGDFIMVLNLWWLYIGMRPDSKYFSWVWQSMKTGRKSKIDNNTIGLILKRHPYLSIDDIEYLYDNHNDVFNEEVEYYKKIEEDYG